MATLTGTFAPTLAASGATATNPVNVVYTEGALSIIYSYDGTTLTAVGGVPAGMPADKKGYLHNTGTGGITWQDDVTVNKATVTTDVGTATVTATGTVKGNKLESTTDVATATVTATGLVAGDNLKATKQVDAATIHATKWIKADKELEAAGGKFKVDTRGSVNWVDASRAGVSDTGANTFTRNTISETDGAWMSLNRVDSGEFHGIRFNSDSTAAGYMGMNSFVSESIHTPVLTVHQLKNAATADAISVHKGGIVSPNFSVKGDGSLMAAGGKFNVDAAGHLGIDRAPRGSWEIASQTTFTAGNINGCAYFEDLSTDASKPETTAGVLLLRTAATGANSAKKHLLSCTRGTELVAQIKGDGSGYFAGRVDGLSLKARGTLEAGGSFRVSAAGNVGIGDYAPTGIRTWINPTATDSYALRIRGGNITNPLAHTVVIEAKPTDRALSVWGGQQSLNRTFHVMGDGTVWSAKGSTAAAYTVTSDPRLKSTFTAPTTTLADFRNIEVGEYTLLDDDTNTVQMGFNAESLRNFSDKCGVLTSDPVPEFHDLYHDDVEVPEEGDFGDEEAPTRIEKQRNETPLHDDHAVKAVSLGSTMASMVYHMHQMIDKIEALESKVAKLEKK